SVRLTSGRSCRDQLRWTPVPREPYAVDPYSEQSSICATMRPAFMRAWRHKLRMKGSLQYERHGFWRSKDNDRLTKALFTPVPVLLHGSVIHFQNLQRLAIEDPHWDIGAAQVAQHLPLSHFKCGCRHYPLLMLIDKPIVKTSYV